MNNLANLAVNGRMEAMIVSWSQSEDRQAGPIKRQRLLRVCGDIEKTGYVEVFSLYPGFRTTHEKPDDMTRNGGK